LRGSGDTRNGAGAGEAKSRAEEEEKNVAVRNGDLL